MEDRPQITFGVFTLDPVNESLLKGSEKIHLRPKSFALLHYLAARPGQLATKDQLLDAIWQDCFVADRALKNCVTEIRKALGDPAKAPQFIETAHRRGYRFIGEISRGTSANASRRANLSAKEPGLHIDSGQLVGRTAELAQLRQYLEKAISGTRQVVFITGEQGIGKTALVDAFLKMLNSERQPTGGHLEARRELWTRGQCIKSHGAGEAYMPFWEALTELCHKPSGGRIVSLLQQHAPLWLMQMPSLVGAAQLRSLQRVTLGATRERMLREMANALEAMTVDMPLALVLEDLHWSDSSTLDLIYYLAQRRTAARLLLIGTYRPAETMTDNHPLRTVTQELLEHRQCQELPLVFLSEEAIEEYLAQRFAGHRFPAGTAAWLHRRTEGNPLFLINVLDHLVSHELIVLRNNHWILSVTLDQAQIEVPPTIQQIIERQIEGCRRQEQRLLQAASVVGVEFSAATAAAAMSQNVDRTEILCKGIARRHVLLQSATIRQLPGGRREACYRFSHVLYQNTCYQLLPEELKAQMHRRVAEYIERTNKRRINDFAAPLAMHFEQGREYNRAVKYYQQAAANANSRYAGREAKVLAEHGIQLLEEAIADSERTLIELSLQIELGTALVATRGLGSDEVKRAFARAPELLRKLGKYRRSSKTDLPFSALWGLWNYSRIAGEYSAAREAAERMLELAEAEQDTAMLARAHYALGIIMMDHGELAGALRHMEYGTTIVSRVYTARILWSLGYPIQAMKHVEETLARALAARNSEDCIFAYMATARVHMMRREIKKALDCAKKALNLARRQGILELWLAPMRSIYGWALAKLGRTNEGIEQMRQILAAYQGIRDTNIKPFLLAMLAEILGDAGQIEEAFAAIQEALNAAGSTGMHNHEAEICRLKGELLLKKANGHRLPGLWVEAESCFEQAVAIARRQKARSFELRATTSLARLFQRQNRLTEARKRLTRIYKWFTEGQDTSDLREAHELIRELSLNPAEPRKPRRHATGIKKSPRTNKSPIFRL